MIVFSNRQNKAGHITAAGGIEAVVAFHDVPTVIAAFRNDIDLLKAVLAYVSHEQAPATPVKREAPGITETKSPNFGPAAAARERIVRRNVILQSWVGAVDIDAHQLAQERRGVLAVTEWIAPAPAIAQAKIEKAIGAKGELAGFVIVEVANLVHRKKNALRGHVYLVGIGGRSGVFGNDRLNLPAHGAHIVHI